MKEAQDISELNEMVITILERVKANYSERPQAKTVIMNLTTVSKELADMRIKSITEAPNEV